MHIKVFFIFFFTSLSIQAQEFDRHTVIKEYEKINEYKSLEVKQDSIYKLSRKILIIQSSDALSLFKTLDSLVVDKQLKLSYLMNWATSEFRFGKKDQSKFLRLKGLEIANKYGTPTDKYDYTGLMSNFYINIQQADSASYYCIAFEKLINQYPEELNQYMWSVHLKHYYIQNILGNEALVDESIEKSWSAMTEFPKQKNYGFLLYLITDHFRKRKNYEKQTKYAELLIKYYNKKKVSTPDAHFPVETVLYEKDSPEAINQLKKVIDASQKTNSLNTFSYTSSGLARLYLDSNQPENAIDVLQRAINKLDGANFSAFKAVKYELLQKAYIQKNDYKEAYAMLGVQKQVEDSLRSNEQLDKIANYKVKYETEKKEARLELLTLEKENEKQKKNLFLIIASLGLLLVGLIAYFFCKNKEKNKKLNNQNAILQRTIDEKNVLLKEVHHRVKNSFQIVSSLLYLQSENITDKNAKLAIKEAENRVRSMVLVHQKLYKEDDLIGINSKEYISDLVKDIFESHGPKDQLITYNLDIEPIVLDIETITPLGLILNELIINTMKHAFTGLEKDNTIDVNFSKVDDKLVLKVIDNGKGFEGDIKQSSFGISLMKGLSKQLKASLNYNSKLKEGTQVILSISKFNILS